MKLLTNNMQQESFLEHKRENDSNTKGKGQEIRNVISVKMK